MEHERKNIVNEEETDKPFDKDILEEASSLAKDWPLEFEEHERLGFIGHFEYLPGVFFDGKTEEGCEKEGRKALPIYFATMIENGQKSLILKIKDKL